MSEELQRQININLQLRRQLERARREVLLYAAQFCEDHHMVWTEGEGWGLVQSAERNHGGRAYATKLREIAGE